MPWYGVFGLGFVFGIIFCSVGMSAIIDIFIKMFAG